ncbi:hypothetical protein E4U55_004965 [Claviceps digitariae]|nr:hypothetical protein E4U55_004965 [Claviceps digitariae]
MIKVKAGLFELFIFKTASEGLRGLSGAIIPSFLYDGNNRVFIDCCGLFAELNVRYDSLHDDSVVSSKGNSVTDWRVLCIPLKVVTEDILEWDLDLHDAKDDRLLWLSENLWPMGSDVSDSSQ